MQLEGCSNLKNDKNFQKMKKITKISIIIFRFLFAVANYIAHKMLINSDCILRKNYRFQHQFKTSRTSIPKNKQKICIIFSLETIKKKPFQLECMLS